MGNMLASTDADGMLKLWDTRMVRVYSFMSVARLELLLFMTARKFPGPVPDSSHALVYTQSCTLSVHFGPVVFFPFANSAGIHKLNNE